MKRLGVAFFYDDHGIVDDYMIYLVQEMMKFTTRMIFISNGPIREEDKARVTALGAEIILRDNIGFDVWAYKTAIEAAGYDNLANYDEILLFNHTFYGPIYPFEEMFDKMDATSCDFWGITAHKELVPNPFTQKGILPWHLNSHFIAVRKPMLTSADFKDYWVNMPMIKSYEDSVLTHESRFSSHFQRLGYKCAVYDDDELYSSKYPCFVNVDESLENRCPILKRRIFFHDPIMIEGHAIDLPRALKIMRETSSYDEAMIWKNIIRTATLRTLNTNASLTSVLPDSRLKPGLKRKHVKRIAVCAHVYYVDMIEELLSYTQHIDAPYDFIATTDTQKKKNEIERKLAGKPGIKSVIVRVLKVNRGRDMSSLFISCRDLFLEDKYDLVCRLHTKKSPQVDTARANSFKRHLFENLMHSKGYVSNIIDMFEEKPWIGVAVPPAVHTSYSTLGLGWFANKPRAQELVKQLDLRVKLDENTPVAAYGTMFWFRPVALKKLFEHKWAWEDFNAEPQHVDGGLAHVLERLICYAAQDATFTTEQIMCEILASQNYAMLEFKFQLLSSYLPKRFDGQVWMLKNWQAVDHALPPIEQEIGTGITFKNAWYKGEYQIDDLQKGGAELIESFNLGRQKWQVNGVATHDEGALVDIEILQRDVGIIWDFMRSVGSTNWIGGHAGNLKGVIFKYVISGWFHGEDIFALFDTAFYLSKYTDVAESGINPFVHYILHGFREGRQPHPLFDPAFYVSQYPNVDFTQINTVAHFLQETTRRASPFPLFDAVCYDIWYPDVAQAGMNGLVHYLRYGAAEGRSPHVLFDPYHYINCLGSKLPADVNPLVHYVQTGHKARIDPHPLFDIRYYLSQQSQAVSGEPLAHFLATSPEILSDPHPLFDVQDYMRRYAHLINHGMNPLEHFMKYGIIEGCEAHPLFSNKFYLSLYKEVGQMGMNPLVHYVKYGVGEMREPSPDFDMSYYMRTNPGIADDGWHPFVHFLKYGWSENRNPNDQFDMVYYLKHHPEIGKGGFNPLAFYIRFGRDLGHSTNAQSDAKPVRQTTSAKAGPGRSIVRDKASARKPGKVDKAGKTLRKPSTVS